jgi:hypothetical protein
MVYISDQILRLFEIGVSLNTLSHLIRQMPDVKTVDWIPMERARVAADSAAIKACYAKIAELIDGVLRESVLNTDETGFADYVDARDEGLIVPATNPHATTPIPLDRHNEAINSDCCGCRRRDCLEACDHVSASYH